MFLGKQLAEVVVMSFGGNFEFRNGCIIKNLDLINFIESNDLDKLFMGTTLSTNASS